MKPYRYPAHPNRTFSSRPNEYTHLSSLGESPLAPVSMYHGYMKFRKPPQVNRPGSKPRKLLTSTTYRPALFTTFLMDREDDNSERNKLGKDYFSNTSGDYILQGLVLEELVAARPLCDLDASNPRILQSGREGLKALHEKGVLHGDVKNTFNAMVSSTPDTHVIWIDFSMAQIGGTRFVKNATREIRLWNP
jgi:hypothetical protein